MTLFKKLERGLKEAIEYKKGKKEVAAKVHELKSKVVSDRILLKNKSKK